jgi:hypothetical protein
MRELFENVFLQQGHIGSCCSSFVEPDSSPCIGVVLDDRDWLGVWKEKLTGSRLFRLIQPAEVDNELYRIQYEYH